MCGVREHTVTAVAGTFNVVHSGHLKLLERAFELGDLVLVGITSDGMASSSRDSIIPLEIRTERLTRVLGTMGPFELFVIDDMYGPDEMMDRADILIVSEETLENGRILNSRRQSMGKEPLEISVVPLVKTYDDSKLSSTDILDGRYGLSGSKDVISIGVGSTNPVKVEAVRNVATRIFGDVRIVPEDVSSGVPDQPFEGQTRIGAENRARAALKDHDLSFGIEAGVFEMPDGLYDVQHCAVIDKDGRITYGQGSGFKYPDEIADLVRKGKTVGQAVKDLYGESEIGKRSGAIGLLSHGLLTRIALTEQSVTAAMILRIWES